MLRLAPLTWPIIATSPLRSVSTLRVSYSASIRFPDVSYEGRCKVRTISVANSTNHSPTVDVRGRRLRSQLRKHQSDEWVQPISLIGVIVRHQRVFFFYVSSVEGL